MYDEISVDSFNKKNVSDVDSFAMNIDATGNVIALNTGYCDSDTVRWVLGIGMGHRVGIPFLH
jgi:hypothetical protein